MQCLRRALHHPGGGRLSKHRPAQPTPQTLRCDSLGVGDWVVAMVPLGIDDCEPSEHAKRHDNADCRANRHPSKRQPRAAAPPIRGYVVSATKFANSP